MHRTLTVFGGLATLLISSASVAEPKGEEVDPITKCELHVWAAEYGVVPGAQGPSDNLLVRVETPSDDPLTISSIMDVRQRIADLTEADVLKALPLMQSYSVVVHKDKVLSADVVVGSKDRLSHSSNPCYADLLLLPNTFMLGERSYSGRDVLNYKFYLRQFGKGGTVTVALKGDAAAEIGAVLKTAKSDRQAALVILRQAMPKLMEAVGEKITKKQHGKVPTAS